MWMWALHMTQLGQMRAPQDGVGVQPIGMAMPPPGTLPAGMPLQQNVPMFGGIDHATN